MKDLTKIKLFAMDVDGTLTDGNIYMGNDGELCKAFNVKDGLGIKLLKDSGIVPAIITVPLRSWRTAAKSFTLKNFIRS